MDKRKNRETNFRDFWDNPGTKLCMCLLFDLGTFHGVVRPIAFGSGRGCYGVWGSCGRGGGDFCIQGRDIHRNAQEHAGRHRSHTHTHLHTGNKFRSH